MRPRVFPAEDLALADDDAPAGHASMRPRVFPSEDANQGLVVGSEAYELQ